MQNILDYIMRLGVCLVMLVSFAGCFDLLKSEERGLIGNISVINSHEQPDSGFVLVFNNGEFNENIIEDPVVEVVGNDSLLFVQAVDMDNCQEQYYRISHTAGKSTGDIIHINAKEFELALQQVRRDVRFSTSPPSCR